VTRYAAAMPTRRSHYERAFGAYLERRGASYALMSDAKRVVADPSTRLRPPALRPEERERLLARGGSAPSVRTLKSFDLVIYDERAAALVDVKGRKVTARLESSPAPRLENWVTEDDVDSLLVWETLFGEGFEAAFVFVYWCETRPPATLFDDAFEHHGRWYGLRSATLSDYRGAMRPRSARWRTVHLDRESFERLSRPLFGPA